MNTMLKYLFSILITAVFIVADLQAQNATSCYQLLHDNSGITGAVGITEAEAAACDLIDTIPEAFRPQFKVYSSAYYFHTGVTTPGFPPMLEKLISDAAAQTPYYLIIARESAPDGLFKNFKIALKLPDTGPFSCLTEEDKSFMSAQLSEIANETFAEKNRIPIQYPLVEKAVIDKLKRYIQKAMDCCASGNKMAGATCSFCPDIAVAARIKRFFEDTLQAVKIPVIVDPNSAKPVQKITYQNVTVSDDQVFKFRTEDESGAIAEVIETVFNSDYFSPGDYKAGFVSSNQSACLSFPDFTTLKAQYKLATEQEQSFVIWAHLWEDPADDAAQDYLYISGKNPVWDNLQDVAVEGKVLASLNNSFQFDISNTVFESKFKQSAMASVFPVVAKCYEEIETEIIPFFPNYSPANSQIYCDNQLLIPSWFLSPAMQPVKIPADAIPDFSNSYWSTIFAHDVQALTFFTTQTERWHGCFHPVIENNQKVYDRFTGYYSIYTKGVGKYVALDTSQQLPNVFDVLIQTTYSAGERELEYKSYYPPASRVPEKFASGLLVKVFSEGEGLKPYVGFLLNPNPYNVNVNTSSTINELTTALKYAQYSPGHQGLILKVPFGNKFIYYKIGVRQLPNMSSKEIKWYAFNCGTGAWTVLPQNPFELNDPEMGEFYLNLALSLETIHTSLGILGIIPVFGVVFDVLDGVVYIVEGDKVAAAVSFTAAALPAIVDAGVKGAKLIKQGANGTLEKLKDIYSNIPNSSNKIDEAAELVSGSQTSIKSLVIATTCALGNKGAAVTSQKCYVYVPVAKMLEKAKSLGDVTSSEWKLFVETIQTKAFPPAPLTRDMDFVQEVGKITQGGPDLFHAWNYARKAGQTLDLNQLKKLGDDLEGNSSFFSALKADPDLVKVWGELEISGVGKFLRVAPELLATAKTHLNDPVFLSKLAPGPAGKQRYLDIIKNYLGKCSTCGNLGSKYLPKIDVYLGDVKNFADKFHGVEGFDVPFFNNQIYAQEGFYHMMKHMNEIPNPSNVKKIDMTFEDELGNSLPCTGGSSAQSCFDVEFFISAVGDLKYHEYKSFLSASIPNITYNQFKSYLSSIEVLKELKYVFDGKKATQAEVYSGMTNYLKSKASSVITDLGQAQFKKLFGVNTAEKLIDGLNDTTFAKNLLDEFIHVTPGPKL